MATRTPKSTTVVFREAEAIADLATFLGRATVVDSGATRLVAKGGALAVWVQVLSPRGLNDTTPTVLGLRGAELAVEAKFDLVVPIESLRARLAAAVPVDGGLEVTLPAVAPSISWKIALPTLTEWNALGKISAGDLATVAKEGAKIIKRKIPASAQEYVVRSVRSQVWGTPINNSLGLPAGVAFAAELLGFLASGTLSVSSRDPWIRVAANEGDILAKATEPMSV